MTKESNSHASKTGGRHLAQNNKEFISPSELGFAASEAYRLLRTNLMFSLPDEQRCRVIGVTSADAGEGKSTTALNLSYMLAESGKKVLLIESDMRLPSISKRLGINPTPGLSNLLVGLSAGKQVLQESGIAENSYLISSGDIPPNPSELLGSEQMKTALEVMSQRMDFIILDLPPINEVADALVASRLTDGIVMVVRQNYATRRGVADAMRQLEHAEARVLGFVVNGADTQKKGKYKKYRKYGYGYGYGYGGTKKNT